MKKQYLIIFVALLLLLFVGLGTNYLLSLRKVSFSIADTTDAISIYTSEDVKKGEFSESGNLLLQTGEYYIVPEGENISNDKINFTVEDRDMTINIDPSYTDTFLSEELESELGAIESAIAAKYPAIYSDYTLAQGVLYEQGQWFGGLLKPKVNDASEQKDPYRVVLQKKGTSWEIIRRPEYILTSSRYKEVPVEVLREINAIVGEPGN